VAAFVGWFVYSTTTNQQTKKHIKFDNSNGGDQPSDTQGTSVLGD